MFCELFYRKSGILKMSEIFYIKKERTSAKQKEKVNYIAFNQDHNTFSPHNIKYS